MELLLACFLYAAIMQRPSTNPSDRDPLWDQAMNPYKNPMRYRALCQLVRFINEQMYPGCYKEKSLGLDELTRLTEEYGLYD